jgi:anthranilate synthase component 1
MGNTADQNAPFLPTLDRWWTRDSISVGPTHLPFTGGWFLYLGYELAAEIEPTLKLRFDSILPVAFAVRCKAAVIFDHAEMRCYLVAESDGDIDVERVRTDIQSAPDEESIRAAVAVAVTEENPGIFTEAVVGAKRHIAAGDIYQANLSREWRANLVEDHDASAMYASLCNANPAPFAGIVHWRNCSILSSSPERLVEVRGGVITTRPIAGMRPRSDDATADRQLLEELISNPKERAEHVMLVDLARNDLGRVSTAGTVKVDEMMTLESYEHVHHIVSSVSGEIRHDISPGDAIAAVFPGGTITGCPKVRCMEVISEFEDAPRGAYTGSFGYLNRDGSLDLNILIRTIVKCGNHIQFRAGAGIVADSEPNAELWETRAKAKGLLRAINGG